MIRVNLLRRMEPKQEVQEGGTRIRFALMGAGAFLILTVAFALLRERVLSPREETLPQLTPETEEARKPSSVGETDRNAMEEARKPSSVEEIVRTERLSKVDVEPSEPEGDYVLRNVLCLSILEALERAIPPYGVWLTSIHSENTGAYVLRGIAFSRERVVEFAKNLLGEAVIHRSSVLVSDEEKAGVPFTFRFTVKGTLSSPPEGDRLRPLSKEAAVRLSRAIHREGEALGLRFFGPPSSERVPGTPVPVDRERLHAEGAYADVRAFLDYLMKELYEPFSIPYLAIVPEDKRGRTDRLNLVLTLDFYVRE